MKEKKLCHKFKIIEKGGVCAPLGYLASGISAGLKLSGKPDMSLLYSQKPACVTGAFTSSLFAAAPVILCREKIKKRAEAQAVIINSGNANACTGKKGRQNAYRMAALTADRLNLTSDKVLVASTGRIGVQLPMKMIEKGIEKAVSKLSIDGDADAARAIMTTDTKPKKIAVSLNIYGKSVKIGGMAKGAGMIAPQLKIPHATMLAFITTDVVINSNLLSECLAEGLEKSFNRITIDGDMSTNDTLLLFANGAAANKKINSSGTELEDFKKALFFVMEHLAKSMVLDGEGVTKFVTVKVLNAASKNAAEICAGAIANSLLCKTAWFGGDPNWGRILAAAGYSGAKFKPGKVSLYYDNTPVVQNGMDAGTSEKQLAKLVKLPQFTVTINLNAGKHSHEIWTNDISYEYVKINADYHT